jgi:hypothetical protein
MAADPLAAFAWPDRAGSRHLAARGWMRGPKTFGRASTAPAARTPAILCEGGALRRIPVGSSKSERQASNATSTPSNHELGGRLRPARPTARRAASQPRLSAVTPCRSRGGRRCRSYDPRRCCRWSTSSSGRGPRCRAFAAAAELAGVRPARRGDRQLRPSSPASTDQSGARARRPGRASRRSAIHAFANCRSRAIVFV